MVAAFNSFEQPAILFKHGAEMLAHLDHSLRRFFKLDGGKNEWDT